MRAKNMSKKIEKDPTNQEILEAIINYASKNDQCLQEIKDEIRGTKSEIGTLKLEVGTMKVEMVTKDYLETKLSNLVTKDYLDDKLVDLKGDLIVLIRQGDVKLMRLVSHLASKKVISKEFENKIKSLEPFTKASI